MSYALVVTLYKGYNYGSALQCFAFQQVIKKYGITPYAIELNNRGLTRHIIRIVNNARFYASCKKYPGRRESFQGIIKNAKEVDNELTKETKDKFGAFIADCIIEISGSYEELARRAKRDECVACISGSDQVWGTSVKYLNPVHFLTFAPENKRYSYAASFGSSTIPQWFIKDIKKYLQSYRKISVRETSALQILDGLGIKNGEVMVDPTLLLTAEEWTRVEKRPEGIKDDFEFIYFLNTPSSVAAEHICRIREYDKKSTACYTPFNNIHCPGNNVETISLSPEEFVWAIHHCKRLYTDSFHGVVFAALFHKDFYVYQREYVGVADQSSRINNILLHLNLSKQFVTEAQTVALPDYSVTDAILVKDREKSYSYLEEILSN